MEKNKEELKEIRKERNNPQEISQKKQKRSVEIIEYEDGTYSLIGYAWDLPLKKDEVLDAVEAWFNGSLENGIPLDED